MNYRRLLLFYKKIQIKISILNMWSIRRKIYGCVFLGILSVFPIQNNGIQGISWKYCIFTIGFPIVMKIFPEIHIHWFSVELIASLKSRFWFENFCRAKAIIYSSWEKYTVHLVRPIKIWKHFSTFFVNKNYRIRVTTYLWERDINSLEPSLSDV